MFHNLTFLVLYSEDFSTKKNGRMCICIDNVSMSKFNSINGICNHDDNYISDDNNSNSENDSVIFSVKVFGRKMGIILN